MAESETPLPSQQYCPGCDRICADDWSFCPSCGKRLDELRTDGGRSAGDNEQAVPHSEMTEQDWQDVAESEFMDVTESAMGTQIGFVFEHPEIGLHGFTFRKNSGKLRPVSYDRTDTDTDREGSQ